MRALRIAAVAMVLVLGSSTHSWAASILYFSDLSQGTDRMAEALAALSGTHTTTTATSNTDFTTQLTTGTFDLAIYFQQNSSGAEFNTAWAALATFVTGGGSAIGADWTRNDTHSAAFDATFTGNANQTQLTVTDPALAAGLTNPVSLIDPGWGVFSTGLLGTQGAVFGNGEVGIVIGNGGRTLFNGFLNDTFGDGSEGVQLYINEIGYVLQDTQPVPEPTSLLLLGTGGLGLLAKARRRRRKQQPTT